MEEKVLNNEILSKKFMEDYNIEDCILVTELLMKKFNRLKNSLPFEPTMRITANYKPIYSCQVPRINDSMKMVDKKIDDDRDYIFMNERLKDIMLMMSEEEAACFTELYLFGKSETKVAERIGRSRDGMRPFANSSAVRVALAFNMAVRRYDTLEIDLNKEIELIY